MLRAAKIFAAGARGMLQKHATATGGWVHQAATFFRVKKVVLILVVLQVSSLQLYLPTGLVLI